MRSAIGASDRASSLRISPNPACVDCVGWRGHGKPDGTGRRGAVRIRGAVELSSIAAVHVDTADAEFAVREAAGAVDAADLGDLDAEFLVGEAEDHELAWYDPSEVAILVELG